MEAVRDLHVRVDDASRVGGARRGALALAERVGFGDEASARVALVVTELARNLVQHARDGEIFVRPLDEPDGAALEVLSVDRGPGIKDVERALDDGYSTATTPGTGLGAVVRQSEHVEITRAPAGGTIVVATLRRERGGEEAGARVGAICRPHPAEKVSGDAWAVCGEEVVSLLLVDGLGHGPEAARPARTAVRLFREEGLDGPAAALERIHEAVRGSRGAVGSVLELDEARRSVRFAGVGNVSAALVGNGGKRSLVSHAGTLGGSARRIREYRYDLPEPCVVVLHSDGLEGRWTADAIRPLVDRSASTVAAALYRAHDRGRDDTTVLALRTGSEVSGT